MKKVFFLVVSTLFAAGVSAQRGTCGTNVSWTIADSTLTISGEGEMNDYNSSQHPTWYIYRSAINRVVVESGVTHLGGAAFGCESGVEGYTNLRHVVFSEGLKSIGDYAFRNCTALRNFRLPQSLEKIGGFSSPEGFVFSGCKALTEVVIPVNVERIAHHSFENCPNLKKVTVEARHLIGESNNYYIGPFDSGVEEVVFGPEARTVAGFLFIGCPNLKKVTTNGFLEYISGKVFSVESPWFLGLSDGLVYLDHVLYRYKGKMSVPTEIKVEEGTTCIADLAFEDQTYLTKITLPSTLRHLPVDYGSPFKGCDYLGEVVWNAKRVSTRFDMYGGSPLPKSVWSLTFGPEVEALSEGSFAFLTGLEQVVLPESLKSIGAGSFFYCEGLKGINLPASLDSIGRDSFSGCKHITSLSVPAGVAYIGSAAFSGVPLDTLVYGVDSCAVSSNAFHCSEPLDYLEITDNVRAVPNEVFYELPGSRVVKVGKGVETINAPFRNSFIVEELIWNARRAENTGYTTVVPEETGRLTIGDGVEYIPSRFMYGNKVHRSIVFPASLAVIGKEAFSHSMLTTVALPGNVTFIADNAFEYCDSLCLLELGTGLRIISTDAFRGCGSLTDVALPVSLDSIADNAFASTGLRSLFVPPTLRRLGSDVFACNDSLQMVVMANDSLSLFREYAYNWNRFPFSDCRSLVAVYVPDSAATRHNIGSDLVKPMARFTGCSKTYDGRPLVPGYESLIPGYGLTVVFDSLAKDAGNYERRFTASFEGPHAFTVGVPCTYTIGKRELRICCDTVSVGYGEPVPATFAYRVEGFAEGEDLETAAFDSLPRMEVKVSKEHGQEWGVLNVSHSPYRIDLVEGPVSRNYRFASSAEGELRVLPRKLYVSVPDTTVVYGLYDNYSIEPVYDGLAYEDRSWDVFGEMPGTDFTMMDAEGGYRKPGTYEVALKQGILKTSDDMPLSNYDVVYKDGTLTVEKCAVEVFLESSDTVVNVGESVFVRPYATWGWGNSLYADDLVFQVSDTACVGVERSGDGYLLVGRKAGEATVTVSYAGNDCLYAAGNVPFRFTVSDPLSVGRVTADDVRITSSGLQLRIEGVPAGTPVCLYDAEGRLLFRTVGKDCTVVCNVPRPGVYLLRAGETGRTFRVK